MNSLLNRLTRLPRDTDGIPLRFLMDKESHEKIAQETNSPGFGLLLL